MASMFVEASSLSDITHLASNPPKYPRNPTATKREPLTLYIARVPGSRDIILTTLKPQLKNVTGQDVTSSLYYLHLNTEDDLRLMDEVRRSMSDERRSRNSSPSQPVARKPLPELSRASVDIQHLDPASKRMDSRSEPSYGVSVSRNAANSQPPSNLRTQNSIRRRPVEVRSPASDSMDVKPPITRIEGVLPTTSLKQDVPPDPPKAGLESTRKDNADGFEAKTFSNAKRSGDPFSITIIRRDPSSGAQWNIGDVNGKPIVDENPEGGSRSPPRNKKAIFDISVHLTAPGYTSFRSPYTATSSSVISGPPTKESIANALVEEDQKESDQSSGFYRKVSMEGSGFWARPSMQHQRTVSGLSAKYSTGRERNYSDKSEAGVSDATTQSNLERRPPGGSDGKGYTFTSLWGGRCKFSTGSGGRSLRCQHTLPNTVSTSHAYDSLAAPQSAAPVSELRFNLPSSDLFASWASRTKEKGTKRFQLAKLGHMRSKSSEEAAPPLPPRPYQTSHQTLHSDDQEDRPPLPLRTNYSSFAANLSDEDDHYNSQDNSNRSYAEASGRWDLSLGQEKAGGGNRGKRAKLGKLVIYDEGFKMLDLVVAANMGIWWSVWESDFR